jgi:hypothetical protein
MCTYDQIRSIKEKEADAFRDYDLMRTLRNLIADLGRKLALVNADSPDQRRVFSEMGSYLLCMLTLIGGRNLSPAMFLDAVLLLSKFQSNHVKRYAKTKWKGQRLAERSLVSDAYAIEFVEKLADNFVDNKLGVNWMYSHAITKFRAAPLVSEWVAKETFSVPDVALPIEFESPSGQLIARLEEIRAAKRKQERH